MPTKKKDEVTIKTRKRNEIVRDRALAGALRRSFQLYRKAKDVEPELQAVKELISARAREELEKGGRSVSFRTGPINLRVTPRTEAVIPEEHIKEVRRLLGNRFRKMIKVRRRYVGSSDLAESAEGKLAGLVDIRELSPRFTWEQG